MYKSCPYCGGIHPAGFRCPSRIKAYTGGDERKLRSKYKWTVKSKEIREKANYLCEVCFDHHQLTYSNLEVHHIIKLKEDENGLLTDANLICLCQEHHKMADAGQLSREYLSSLAKRREEKQ